MIIDIEDKKYFIIFQKAYPRDITEDDIACLKNRYNHRVIIKKENVLFVCEDIIDAEFKDIIEITHNES